MANKPQPPQEPKKDQPDLSRRKLLFGAGVGVAGVVAGGAVGYALPKEKGPSPPTPETWIGRSIADCTGCRLCEIALGDHEQKIQPASPASSSISIIRIEFPVAFYHAARKPSASRPARGCDGRHEQEGHAVKIDTSLCLRTKNGDCTLCLDSGPARSRSTRRRASRSSAISRR
jgi:hypothetical protein